MVIGEIFMIPVVFENFEDRDMRFIYVYRIDNNPQVGIDTLALERVAFAGVRGNEVLLTDEGHGYGDYSSYFNDCSIVFDWETGTDTISNIVVLKSRGKGDRCHKDDPNIRIDKVEFVHKGNLYNSVNDTIVIRK
jgi:hypothetical protein